MRRSLVGHIGLFMLYLITIALLFVGVVLDKALCEQSGVRVWVERAYLFFSVTSFLFTFALPVALLKMQHARFDAETERRRLRDGIGNG